MTDFASQIPLVAAAHGVPGQVAIVVDDLDEALRTWGVADGGREEWRIWTYGPEMFRSQSYLGAPSEHSMMLAMNGASPMLELVQPVTGPSIYHTWRDEGGRGIHHLGYYVDVLAPVIPLMESAGFPCVQTGEGHGVDGSGAFAYFDTRRLLGFYLEGIEVPRQRRPPERVWPPEVTG